MKILMLTFIVLAAVALGCDAGGLLIVDAKDGGCPTDAGRDPVSCLPVGKDGGAPKPCANRPVGYVCGGDADAGIHGECNANEVCEWTDRSCADITDCVPHWVACMDSACVGGLCIATPSPDGTPCHETWVFGHCLDGVCQ